VWPARPSRVHLYLHALGVKKFLSRLSSPLLDRINLQAKVPPVPYRDLASTSAEESLVMIRARMNAVRARQQ
jgi:magnesium chelatase family protein